MAIRRKSSRSSAPLSKFVIHCSTTRHELRKHRGTSKFMILVPLFDLKFLDEFAAGGAGTSNRRHQTREERIMTQSYDKIDGVIWYDGKVVRWGDANMHVLSHGL